MARESSEVGRSKPYDSTVGGRRVSLQDSPFCGRSKSEKLNRQSRTSNATAARTSACCMYECVLRTSVFCFAYSDTHIHVCTFI